MIDPEEVVEEALGALCSMQGYTDFPENDGAQYRVRQTEEGSDWSGFSFTNQDDGTVQNFRVTVTVEEIW